MSRPPMPSAWRAMVHGPLRPMDLPPHPSDRRRAPAAEWLAATLAGALILATVFL